MEIGVFAPLGEFNNPMAVRKNVRGTVIGYLPVMWNMEKQ